MIQAPVTQANKEQSVRDYYNYLPIERVYIIEELFIIICAERRFILLFEFQLYTNLGCH